MRIPIISLALLVTAWLAVSPAAAQHAGDIAIGSAANSGGALVGVYDFANKVLVSESFSGGGTTLYSTTDPGFDLLSADVPGAFALDSGVAVRLELTGITGGASMKIGAVTLDAVGESALLGSSPSLHVHPEWRLTLPSGVTGDYPLSFKLTTSTAGYVSSAPYTAVLTNLAPAATSTATTTPTVATTPTVTATPTPTSAPPAATCAATPRACAAAGKAVFKVTQDSDPTKRALLFKWLRGTIAAAELGDPRVATSLALCVYDDGALVGSHPVAAGAMAWKATGKGFKFIAKSGNPAGITLALLASGVGKAKLVVKGKGVALALPSGNPLFADTAGVSVQLANNTGSCWGAVFAPPAAVTDAGRFKDVL